MEKIVFGDSETDLPKEIIENADLLGDILCEETLQSHFTEQEKQHLLTLLPEHESIRTDPQASKMQTMNCLLRGETFNFRNPLQHIANQLKAGFFNAASHAHLMKRRADDYQQQQTTYYARLLQQLLINKQGILHSIGSDISHNNTQQHQPPPVDHHYSSNNTQHNSLRYKANQKCYDILKEIKERLGQATIESSDDDDDDVSCGDDSDDDLLNIDEEELERVLAGIVEPAKSLEARVGGRRVRGKGWGKEGVDVKEVLRMHRKRRNEEIHIESFYITPKEEEEEEGGGYDVSLEDIMLGLGVKKQDIIAIENKAKEKRGRKLKKMTATSSPSKQTQHHHHQHQHHHHHHQRRRHKGKLANDHKLHEDDDEEDEGGGRGDDDDAWGGDDDDYDKEDGDDDGGGKENSESFNTDLSPAKTTSSTSTSFSCFFSLIRHLLSTQPSSTLFELQGALQQWLERATHNDNAWVYENSQWESLLQPALTFLAGVTTEGHSDSMTFTPMVCINKNKNKNNNNNGGDDNDPSTTTTTYTWIDNIDTSFSPVKNNTSNNNNNNNNINKNNKTPNINNNTPNNNNNNNSRNKSNQGDNNNNNLDDLLLVLNYHWTEGRKGRGLRTDVHAAAIPPSLVKTDYIVGRSSQEDKTEFRIQERQRFLNPHKAFTYHCHGYQSVVGPVKGIYSKESPSMKARGHVLLVAKRPHCVNILTLVNDCAARLPNGEGTRYEICELMRDSQYICPSITEAQLNAVVSGALDRLHYDKDPSVRYLSGQKMWVYLHRNRTQEDFERMHLVQRATARARKLATSKKSHLSVLQQAFKKKEGKKRFSGAYKLFLPLTQPTSTTTTTTTSTSLPLLPPHQPTIPITTTTLPLVTATHLAPPLTTTTTSSSLPTHSILNHNSRLTTPTQRVANTRLQGMLPTAQFRGTESTPLPFSPSLLNAQQSNLLIQQLQQQTVSQQQQPKQGHSILRPQLINNNNSKFLNNNNNNNLLNNNNNINNLLNNKNIIGNNIIFNSLSTNIFKASTTTQQQQHFTSKTFNISTATSNTTTHPLNILPNDKLNPLAIPNAFRLNHLNLPHNSLQQQLLQQLSTKQVNTQQHLNTQQQQLQQGVLLGQKLQQQLQLQQKQLLQKQLQTPRWFIATSNKQQLPPQQHQPPQQQQQRTDNQVKVVFQQRPQQQLQPKPESQLQQLRPQQLQQLQPQQLQQLQPQSQQLQQVHLKHLKQPHQHLKQQLQQHQLLQLQQLQQQSPQLQQPQIDLKRPQQHLQQPQQLQQQQQLKVQSIMNLINRAHINNNNNIYGNNNNNIYDNNNNKNLKN